MLINSLDHCLYIRYGNEYIYMKGLISLGFFLFFFWGREKKTFFSGFWFWALILITIYHHQCYVIYLFPHLSCVCVCVCAFGLYSLNILEYVCLVQNSITNLLSSYLVIILDFICLSISLFFLSFFEDIKNRFWFCCCCCCTVQSKVFFSISISILGWIGCVTSQPNRNDDK